MNDHIRSKAHPFGSPPHDILIVCRNSIHMDYVQRAFQINAYYTVFDGPLLGYRFKKIIIFRPDSNVRHAKDIIDHLRTKLDPGEELHFV